MEFMSRKETYELLEKASYEERKSANDFESNHLRPYLLYALPTMMVAYLGHCYREVLKAVWKDSDNPFQEDDDYNYKTAMLIQAGREGSAIAERHAAVEFLAAGHELADIVHWTTLPPQIIRALSPNQVQPVKDAVFPFKTVGEIEGKNFVEVFEFQLHAYRKHRFDRRKEEILIFKATCDEMTAREIRKV